jgi:hypothetical protein
LHLSANEVCAKRSPLDPLVACSWDRSLKGKLGSRLGIMSPLIARIAVANFVAGFSWLPSAQAQNTSPVVTLTNPGEGAVYQPGIAITLMAAASDPDGNVVQVDFFANGAFLGSDFVAPYQLPWTVPGVGDFKITAVVQDNLGASVTSAQVSILVKVVNDDFAERTLLSGRVVEVISSNLEATKEPGEPDHAGKIGGRSVWWSWQAPAPGQVTISTKGTAFDSLLAVYKGSSLAELSLVASNDDDPSGGTNSLVSLVVVEPGTFYQIAVDGFNQQTGEVVLKVSFTENLAPLVEFTSPLEASSVATGSVVSLEASASDLDGTVVQVDFYVGAVFLGSDSSAPFSSSWTPITAGAYTLKAIATDNYGYRSSPWLRNVTVTNASGSGRFAFAKVADSGLYGFFDSPDINNLGTVVFGAYYAPNPQCTDCFSPSFFRWNGGTPSIVYPNLFVRTPSAPRINDTGMMVFFDDNENLLMGDGGPLSTLAVTPARFGNLGPPHPPINSAGAVAYSRNYVIGVGFESRSVAEVRKNDGISDITVATSGVGSGFVVAGINNAGRVAFSGTLAAGSNVIAVGNGSETGILYDTATGPFIDFAALDFNDSGKVAFGGASTNLAGEIIRGLYVGDGIATSTIYLDSGPLGTLTTAGLNNRGQVAFLAAVDTGGFGLFVGPDPFADKVIQTGDQLSGKTVSNLGYSGAFNDNGQIAFWVAFADGTSAVYVAIPLAGSNTPPVISLTSPASGTTFNFGSTASLTAQATDSDGTIRRVDFYASGAFIGADATSPFSLDWTPTNAGGYNLTAVATDNSGSSTISASVGITVLPPSNALPVVSLTNPGNGAVYQPGSSISLIAVASDPDGSVARVDFYANETSLGNDTEAPFSLNWTPAQNGTYALKAIATDNKGAPTTSALVNISIATSTPPVVSLTSPTNGATFSFNSTIPLAAQATHSDGAVLKVDFYAGATLIGTDATPPFSLDWTPTNAGDYKLTAMATDNHGIQTTSATVRIIVWPSLNILPVISWSNPGEGAAYQLGIPITMVAAANDPDGTVAGVDFFANGVLLGSDSSAPFELTWTPHDQGDFTITAEVKDNLGARTTSTPVRITISAPLNAPPFVELSAPTNTASFVLGSTVTLAASGLDEDGTISQVDFYANGNLVGTDGSAPYSVVWTPQNEGDYTLKAVAIDDDGALATSSFKEIKVVRVEPPVSFALDSIRLLNDGRFQFKVSATGVSRVIIQTSDDLIAWKVFADVEVNGGALDSTFFDTILAGMERRFYRIVYIP